MRFRRVSDPLDCMEAAEEAGRVLRSGGLVVFPTETIYGIACADAPECVDRLFAAKKRPREKRVAHYVGSWRDFLATVAAREIDPPGEVVQFAKHAFPGPVTIVLRRGEETIGVRCCDHPVARALVEAARGPVVGSSANLSGQPPARTATEAVEQLGDAVDLVLDAGPSERGEPSTVVQFDETGLMSVLREGAVRSACLKEYFKTWLLFVCTANLCRSPFAAAACEMRFEQQGSEAFHVGSAGVHAVDGFTPSKDVCDVAKEYGVDLSRHRSRAATRERVEKFDLVFTMERRHLEELRDVSLVASEVAHLLNPCGDDIADPIGGPLDAIRSCFDLIVSCIEQRLPELCELR